MKIRNYFMSLRPFHVIARSVSDAAISLITFAIFFFLCHNTVLSEPVVVERVVAIVNGEVILLSELESALSPLRKQYEVTYEGEELVNKLNQAKEEILNKLIETKILLQEAKSRSIEAGAKEVSAMLENVKKTFASEEKFTEALKEQKLTLTQFSERLENQLRIKRLVDQEVKLKAGVDIEEIRNYYETNKDEFFHKTQYRIKHILIKDKPGEEVEKKAQEVLAKVKEGEDFSMLAKKYSEDPNALSGGDLGFLEEDKLIPEIREVIKTLKAGEVSGIIKTRLGYQIMTVEAIKEAEAKSFDEVKEKIRQNLFEKKFPKIYQEWIADLKQNSYIYIKK